jgi:membrane-associated phospholipid phosphatase
MPIQTCASPHLVCPIAGTDRSAAGVRAPSAYSRDRRSVRVTVVLAPARADGLIRSSSVLRRWERGLLQIVTVSWMYAIYEELRAAATGSTASAMNHARQIAGIERAGGISIEHAVQEVTVRLPWLVGVCNVCYSATHLVAPPIVLAILYRMAPGRYRKWRDVFLVMLGLSLLCFLLYPVLPPRLVPGSHHVADTTRSYFNVDQVPGAGLVTAASRSTAPQWAPFTNPMAAMPSLHVGWAVWASVAVWPVVRRRRVRWVIAAYPVLMIWSVLVTGNHWLLDTVGGVAVVAIAYLVTHLVSSTVRGRIRSTLQPNGSETTRTSA